MPGCSIGQSGNVHIDQKLQTTIGAVAHVVELVFENGFFCLPE